MAAAHREDYLAPARISEDGRTPLFRSSRGRTGRLTSRPIGDGVLRIVNQRARTAGLSEACCRRLQASGSTPFVANAGEPTKAQAMANHELPQATKLYDRPSDELTQDDIERIGM